MRDSADPVADRVRAIVLNYGEPLATVACVKSLLRQAWSPLDVVVVDNFASTESVEVLKGALPPGVHLILNASNLGYAAGNNVGCRHDLGNPPKYVLIINNDAVLVGADDIARLVRAISMDQRVGAISPLVNTLSSTLEVTQQVQVRRDVDFITCLVVGSWWLRRLPGLRTYHGRHVYREMMPFALGRIYPCDSVNGSCFLIRYDLLVALGLFDEGTFLYFEEIILGRQIRDRGMKCALTTSVVVEHHQGLSTKQRGKAIPWRMHRHAVRSEMHYCIHYLRAGYCARGLLQAVRMIDYCSKRVLSEIAWQVLRTVRVITRAARGCLSK